MGLVHRNWEAQPDHMQDVTQNGILKLHIPPLCGGCVVMSIASATGTSVSGIHACSLPQTPYTSMQQGVRTQDMPEIHLEDESH